METTSRATVLPMASRYVGTSCITAAATVTGAGGRSKPCCAALLVQPVNASADTPARQAAHENRSDNPGINFMPFVLLQIFDQRLTLIISPRCESSKPAQKHIVPIFGSAMVGAACGLV